MSELLNFILDHEDSFKNRARLSSLWSDFPLHKVANPDGYAANINAWKKALFHASRAGLIPTTASTATKKAAKESGTNDVLVLATGQELAKSLEYRPWGIPAGLASVVVRYILRTVYTTESNVYKARSCRKPRTSNTIGLSNLEIQHIQPKLDTDTVAGYTMESETDWTHRWTT